LVDRRISQGAKGEPPVSLFWADPANAFADLVGLSPVRKLQGRRSVTTLPYSKNHPADSFSGFFSGLFAGAGEELFVAASLGALGFSPAFWVAGDSFLAASLYESLR
jgi:hypothetical protein